MAAARTATAKGEGTVVATKRYENIGYCRRWAAVCVERVRIREQDGGDVEAAAWSAVPSAQWEFLVM